VFRSFLNGSKKEDPKLTFLPAVVPILRRFLRLISKDTTSGVQKATRRANKRSCS
jgi:hypothetical protein